MSNDTNRILSYQLSTPLAPIELENVSGGAAAVVKAVGTQKMRGTQGGDTTIDFDAIDFEN